MTMTNHDPLPLHQEFAKIASTLKTDVEKMAKHWAAWLIIAHNEYMALCDVLYQKEADDDELWNGAQRKFWFVTTTLRDLTYGEIKEMLLQIGDVEQIGVVCTHVVWMYSSTFIEEDGIDGFLEATSKCDGCYYEALLHTFHWVMVDRPLSHDFYATVAHGDKGNWEYLKYLLLEEMTPYVRIFEEYKVEYVENEL